MELTKLKKIARKAGLLYLSLAVCAAFAIAYVPSQIVVNEDYQSTLKNLISNENIFRLGIASHLVSQVLFIFLSLLLYNLFKHINHDRARLMVVLVVVQIPIVFVAEAFNLVALLSAKGDLLKSLTLIERADYVYLLLKLHDKTLGLLEAFWGLWLIPLGLLIYHSRIIPKIIGALVIAGGVAYIIELISMLLFPGIHLMFVNFTPIVYSIAEIVFIFWLLIKGISKPL